MGASAWQALRDLDSWRVTEIPRQAPERSQQAGLAEGDQGAAQRLAALVSAFHSGAGPVAVGWLRLAAGGPVQVLAGGAGLAGGAAPAEGVGLSLPPGVGGGRRAAGGPVQVRAGGAGLAGGAAPAEGVVLSLPAGARGEPLPAEGMGSAFAQLPCWLRIARGEE